MAVPIRSCSAPSLIHIWALLRLGARRAVLTWELSSASLLSAHHPSCKSSSARTPGCQNLRLPARALLKPFRVQLTPCLSFLPCKTWLGVQRWGCEQPLRTGRAWRQGVDLRLCLNSYAGFFFPSRIPQFLLSTRSFCNLISNLMKTIQGAAGGPECFCGPAWRQWENAARHYSSYTRVPD